MSITAAIARLNEVQNELAELDELRKPLQQEYDKLRLETIPGLMGDEGVTSINVAGIGRCTLTGDLYVSAPDKTAMHAWLEDNGHGSLIVETVNAQSLKAFIKEQIKAGTELPETVFKISPFSRAAIYRS